MYSPELKPKRRLNPILLFCFVSAPRLPLLLPVGLLPGQMWPGRGHPHDSCKVRAHAHQQVREGELRIHRMFSGRPEHHGQPLFRKEVLQRPRSRRQLRELQAVSWWPQVLPGNHLHLRQRSDLIPIWSYVLIYDVIWCDVIYDIHVWYDMLLCYAVLHYFTLHYNTLYCIICIIGYYIIGHYMILYDIKL